jgi:hypothetical protein
MYEPPLNSREMELTTSSATALSPPNTTAKPAVTHPGGAATLEHQESAGVKDERRKFSIDPGNSPPRDLTKMMGTASCARISALDIAELSAAIGGNKREGGDVGEPVAAPHQGPALNASGHPVPSTVEPLDAATHIMEEEKSFPRRVGHQPPRYCAINTLVP